MTRPLAAALFALLCAAGPARAQLDGAESRDPGADGAVSSGRDATGDGAAERDALGDDAAERDAIGDDAAERDAGAGDDYPEDGPDDDYPEDRPDETAEPPSPRLFLEAIRIEGNRKTRDGVIRAYVPLLEGDALAADDGRLLALEWRLLGTGWFRRVTVRLDPGARRGFVVLVIEVEERNTIVASQLTFGISEGISRERARQDPLGYFGATVTETNLFGLGASLGLTGFGSSRARGIRLAYDHPQLLPRGFALHAATQYTNARQAFGTDVLVDGDCADRPDFEDCLDELEANNAVAFVQRGVFELGTGRDASPATRVDADWVLEVAKARFPDASETFGSEVRPIDFRVQSGTSYVSRLRFRLTFDRRDDPALPSRGALVRFQADGASRAFGSDYDFVRLQGSALVWLPLPWGHTVRLGAFAGSVFGRAPFWHLFHVSDLTDLIPSRFLAMQLDRRQAPNVFGTAISEFLTGELAGRADVEYSAPLYRREGGGLRALNAYLNVGVLTLANRAELRLGVPGFNGISQVPVDLTFDVGFRFDTPLGVVQLGFSTVLGFIEL
ncbi:MAG: BamA/TamA family outer membrane protein [Myxococcota bacterium]